MINGHTKDFIIISQWLDAGFSVPPLKQNPGDATAYSFVFQLCVYLIKMEYVLWEGLKAVRTVISSVTDDSTNKAAVLQ
jgi:hypothetical protein